MAETGSPSVWSQRTNRGRVVYNRKIHYWTLKDLQRVANHLNPEKNVRDLPALQAFLSWITKYFIGKLLSLYDDLGLLDKESVYKNLLGLVSEILAGLGIIKGPLSDAVLRRLAHGGSETTGQISE